ncbi:MAG: cold-shock protein [Gaiellaceae bacterium]
MIWFNEAENFGYIATDEGERLYAPGSAFPGGKGIEGRCKGIEVTFEVDEDSEGKRVAKDVTLVEYSAPHRARRRHGGRV